MSDEVRATAEMSITKEQNIRLGEEAIIDETVTLGY